MGRLRRFKELSRPERRLVLASAALLTAVRLGLWLLPFRTVNRMTGLPRRGPARIGPARAPAPVDRIVWAVEAASRLVPRSTCLVRALAARTLLARHGYSSALRLGVARGPDGAFQAHAWLERDERVLIGGPVDERFARLPSFPHQA